MILLKKIYPLPLLVLSAWVIACSPKSAEQSETKIIQHQVKYYARYLQDDGSLKGEATFSPRDTSLKQEGQELIGDVFFAGEKMNVYKAHKQGLRYVQVLEDASPKGKSFNLKYSNGTSLSHPINMGVVDSFWTSTPSLSKGFTLSWKGKELDTNETLVLLLTDSKGKTTTMNRVKGSDGSSIKIIPPQLAQVAKGEGRLTLIRKNRQKLMEEGLFFGNLYSEFYTKEIVIMIAE